MVHTHAFIGTWAGDKSLCISCAEDQYGNKVIDLVSETGQQGTYFKAIHDTRETYNQQLTCSQCKTPFNE